ncbi:O-antigen ligase [uncultured Brachybacterium sp.]|uniref:O-antigen ligase family protein n=1 Tax=uncultured Brachybacterium sp. TaxID=189680 RepID=UPI0026312386|nr:O-antigen ligase family protein [uncultured Brachybacterium sp.]
MKRDTIPIVSSQKLMAAASLLYGAVAALDIYPLLGQRTIGSVYSLIFISLVILWKRPGPAFQPAQRLIIAAGFGFFVWSTVSALWAPPQSEVIERFISLAQACTTFGALMLVTPFFRRWITIGLALGATLAALILFTQGETGVNGRLSFGTVDENITAYTFSLGIAAYIAIINRRSTLLLCIAPIAVLFLATVQTGSRTGLAAILVTIVIYPLIVFRRRLGRSLAELSLIVVFLIALREFAIRWEATPDRLRPLFEGDTSISDSGRSAITDQYMQFIDEWWLFGTGLAGGNDFIQSKVALFSDSVHNTVLRVWIETGVIGLILLLAVYAFTLYNGIATPQIQRYLVIIVPTLVFSLSLGGLELSSSFWTSIALVAGSAPGQLGSPSIEDHRRARPRFRVQAPRTAISTEHLASATNRSDTMSIADWG